MFTKDSRELQAASGIFLERQGPCEVLSSRSHDRALYGALAMLERRAVKVACVVLRGLGGREPTWLPGARRKELEMEDLIKAVTETPLKVFSTLLTGAVVAALGFLSASFRRAILTTGLSQQQRLIIVWHSEEEDMIRIIGAREATPHERRIYESGE